jgi:hypothetical protein
LVYRHNSTLTCLCHKQENVDDVDEDVDAKNLLLIVSTIPIYGGYRYYTIFARAINIALDDDKDGGIGYQIAATHDIEVTTPD